MATTWSPSPPTASSLSTRTETAAPWYTAKSDRPRGNHSRSHADHPEPSPGHAMYAELDSPKFERAAFVERAHRHGLVVLEHTRRDSSLRVCRTRGRSQRVGRSPGHPLTGYGRVSR